ncbi:PAS domain-containing protein [Methylobacterium sp. NEAU 140]|uniref:PAS domain-containing protein n=1 Tax=Methylobacterium sp. NEAU 140 TaxID=3064945 RepID=UPI00273629CF|nr:PAS domain-containing protein [Methylobacterium sp. NEAU 140]MDP4024891.1 PAS domain-containing protein [Methylobacterium sp. NEAU 140]
MPRRSSGGALWASPPPLTALRIGVWEDDVGADRTRGDAVMARLFGLSEAEAAEGIAWSRLAARFHPEDLARDTEHRRRVRQAGGLFAWEHRIVPAPGIVRWVLARGHFKRDANGRMRGRGIVIDITDSRTDAQLEGPARFLAARETAGSITEQMAERALDLWELLRDLDAASARRLRPKVEAVLRELGCQIAASLTDEAASAPAPERDPRMH